MKPIIFSFDPELMVNIGALPQSFKNHVKIRILRTIGPNSPELGQNRRMLHRTTKCTRFSQRGYLRQWFAE